MSSNKDFTPDLFLSLAGAAPLAGQLSLFTRELVDLLKATPGCKYTLIY